MSEHRFTVDGQPFLGRLEEQERFRETLRSVQAEAGLIAKVIDWAVDKKPSLPFVFLLYGEGGMGKTYLIKRLRDISEMESPFQGNFATLLLDWEKRRDLDYSLKMRDAVSPETVFEHLFSLFREHDYVREFSDYENALVTRSIAEEKVSKALEKTADTGERYRTLRELGGKGIAWLIRSGIVGGLSIPVPEEPTAKIFNEIISRGAIALNHVRETATTLIRNTLNPSEFDLFTLPYEKLAHSLATGIRNSASSKLIILFLDTYEISDHVDIWLREIIKRSGHRIVWVISGRDNLADSRKFGARYFNGYRGDFPSDRLRVFPLSEFSVHEVVDYCAEYIPERELDLDTARAIHKATIGIPLAVQAAAFMWKSGTALEDIIGNVPEAAKRDEIVKLMTERFLLHCFDDSTHPSDLKNIYALALVYQHDAKLLKATLHSINLEQDLSELERRHSFVFLTQMKLHSSVQAFLREYLLHPLHRYSSDVQTIHQRAIEYFYHVCLEREEQFPELEKAIEDDIWKEARLGLVHHTFWLSSDEGWNMFLPACMAGLAYDHDFARACIETINPFFETFRKPEKHRFDLIKRGVSKAANEDHFLEMLGRLERFTLRESDQHFKNEILACLALLYGQALSRQGKYSDALKKFADVEKYLTPKLEKLKNNLGVSLFGLAKILLNSNPKLKNIWFRTIVGEIIDKAIIWMPDKYYGYDLLGRYFVFMEKYDDAIVAYQKALELKNDYAEAYYGMALAYRNKREIENAISSCQMAIDVDPGSYTALTGLGYLYNQQGKLDSAKRHLEEAVKNPRNPFVFVNLGITFMLMGNLDESNTNFKKAIEMSHANDELGLKGWAQVITGDIQSGRSLIVDALERKDYIMDAQNIFDWTMLLTKAPNPPKEIRYLLELIDTQSAFKDLKKP